MESQHRGNRKAKSMEKREAKGQANVEEAEASMEEAEESVGSKANSQRHQEYKNKKNKEVCGNNESERKLKCR